MAAARILNLAKIPAWQVNEFDEELDWNNSLVRCYRRRDNSRMPLRDLIASARAGRIDWVIRLLFRFCDAAVIL